MKFVYVNGSRHASLHDAWVTTGGSYNGLKKALSLGLPYRGFIIGHEPPENPPPPPPKIHVPGTTLIPNPQVSP